MRPLPILIVLLLLTACCPQISPVPSSEAARNREAQQLVRASLTDRLVQDTVAYYRDQVSSTLAGQGLSLDEAEARVMETMQPLIEAEHQRLVDRLVPVYRRYYTAGEIHQLLSFYQTEVARKSLRVSPRIAAESRQYVRLWSEHFGEEFLKQIDEEYGVTE